MNGNDENTNSQRQLTKKTANNDKRQKLLNGKKYKKDSQKCKQDKTLNLNYSVYWKSSCTTKLLHAPILVFILSE